jgi:hypothetical protein
MNVDPAMDPLRADPRFQALRKRLGFTRAGSVPRTGKGSGGISLGGSLVSWWSAE